MLLCLTLPLRVCVRYGHGIVLMGEQVTNKGKELGRFPPVLASLRPAEGVKLLSNQGEHPSADCVNYYARTPLSLPVCDHLICL
eukprot:COSAG06_NODE_5591_length_3378_cov_1.351327_1_plen_84_part_00